MTSTGAGTPVQSSNDAAPWATSTSSPSTTRRARARAAATRRRRLRIRKIDERLPGAELDEHLVAFRTSR